jgi:eukaryotic-like serine/threonine-protein kinase
MDRGTVFAGDYRIERELARGGMGHVYIAEQISTGRRRALKILRPCLRNDVLARQRFTQEARVRSLIASAHIVEVHAAGVDAITGLPWLVMELLEGETLDERTRRSPLSFADAAFVIRQLCHAVTAAHSAGVYHRDLKPDNVLLSKHVRAAEAYEVKVLDFGIAKVPSFGIISGPALVGTPLWMAPEQARRSPVGPATDVWAIALIAFFTLVGREFWLGASDNVSFPDLLREVLFDPMPAATVRAAALGAAGALPGGFDAWFAGCTQRDPSRRVSSVSDAWRELSTLLGARSSARSATMRATLAAGSSCF